MTIPTTTHPQAAIDFGISNTDTIAYIDGEWRRWMRPYTGHPNEAEVRAILADGELNLDDLPWLGVTGGRHQLLPPQLGDCIIISVGELEAIGRGGQAMAQATDTPNPADSAVPLLVVSAGSGTAMVQAKGQDYSHVTGTAVGGGTLLGLGRLLIQCVDPTEIDQLAEAGNTNGVDLSLADVITGPVGSLPAEATAVNFGRLSREAITPTREDLAAGIITLVGQTIGLIAVNAARSIQTERVVITGHMLDLPSLRRVLAAVGALYGQSFIMPDHAGYATAMGALLAATDQMATPKL